MDPKPSGSVGVWDWNKLDCYPTAGAMWALLESDWPGLKTGFCSIPHYVYRKMFQSMSLLVILYCPVQMQQYFLSVTATKIVRSELEWLELFGSVKLALVQMPSRGKKKIIVIIKRKCFINQRLDAQGHCQKRYRKHLPVQSRKCLEKKVFNSSW